MSFSDPAVIAVLYCVLAIALIVAFRKMSAAKELENTALDMVTAAAEKEDKATKELAALHRDKEILRTEKKLFECAFSKEKDAHRALAAVYADAKYDMDMIAADVLRWKARPAIRASDELGRIAKEKRELAKDLKQLQYQLKFYEELFPWLEDFKEIPPKAAEDLVRSSEGDGDYDYVRNWLSPEEYANLKNNEKFQLALDRWQSRNKSKWEIGIDYERCVGYQLEQRGYSVKYTGALQGLEDMGRDLIAEKDGEILVVQCKRWAKEKVIHEKHICQLYGSVAVLSAQNPHNKYKGVFVTSTNLSDTAKLFANYSNLAFVENCEPIEYPLIKCNRSKTGEKIYHLPFDQQYDKIVMQRKKSCFYVSTVKEAEKLGYRRAYRWQPSRRD